MNWNEISLLPSQVAGDASGCETRKILWPSIHMAAASSMWIHAGGMGQQMDPEDGLADLPDWHPFCP